MGIARIPDRILLSPDLPSLAKNLWGVLTMFRGQPVTSTAPCRITQAQLATCLRTTRPTIRKNLRTLESFGFLEIVGPGQYRPIDPEMSHQLAELETVKARLENTDLLGQTIVEVTCEVVVDRPNFIRNARLESIKNPSTWQSLELDLYDPVRKVAIEFNGAQHYHTTERYPDQKSLRDLMLRDLVKEAQCARNGITLITLTTEDLSVKAIVAKIGDALPIRAGAAQSIAAAYIDKVCYYYRKKAQEEPFHGRGPYEKEGTIHRFVQGVSTRDGGTSPAANDRNRGRGPDTGSTKPP